MIAISLQWLLWVIIPALSLSYLSTPNDPEIMRVMADENRGQVTDWKRFSVYFLLRFVPTLGILLWIFSVSAAAFAQKGSRHSSVADLPAQSVLMFFYVFYLALPQAMSFVHRTKSIWDWNPFNNRHWVVLHHRPFVCL